MLDIKRLREQTDEVRSGLISKNVEVDLERILQLDKERRELLTDVESLKNERNVESKKIGVMKKNGEDISAIQHSMKALSDRVAELDQKIRDIKTELDALMLAIPNVPSASAPVGSDASENKVVRIHGAPVEYAFEPLPHWEVGKKLGMLDFDRGAKITGAGFPLFTGPGARLQRALIQFMLDVHTQEHGYTEVLPPFVVNPASMTGTGQLPKMAEDMYFVSEDDLYLIPTAEVPVTNIYREEIIKDALPISLTAYTPCFRREAGAAGKDTRGLIRVHQFDKVEMVKFVEPETSYDELEKLVRDAEDILQRLDLHYRILELCTGDLSFAAAKCYDIELWAPAQKTWLEVSSCSNFEDFQARRAQIRYRTADKKNRFVHTLNGSGVALPRLMVAILECCQNADGSVNIPSVLQPYMGGMQRIESAG